MERNGILGRSGRRANEKTKTTSQSQDQDDERKMPMVPMCQCANMMGPSTSQVHGRGGRLIRRGNLGSQRASKMLRKPRAGQYNIATEILIQDVSESNLCLEARAYDWKGKAPLEQMCYLTLHTYFWCFITSLIKGANWILVDVAFSARINKEDML